MISAFLLMQTILAADLPPRSARIIPSPSPSTLTTTQGETAPQNINSTRPSTPTEEETYTALPVAAASTAIVEMRDVLPAAGAQTQPNDPPSTAVRNGALATAVFSFVSGCGVLAASYGNADFKGHSTAEVLIIPILTGLLSLSTAVVQQVRLYCNNRAPAPTTNEPVPA